MYLIRTVTKTVAGTISMKSAKKNLEKHGLKVLKKVYEILKKLAIIVE